jgi:toxin-antitoxin system PIN domain toxin
MIVDANILIYAVNLDSKFHKPAAGWLSGALNGPERVALPWASLLGFQRLATSSRVLSKPLSPQSAWSLISDWLGAENTWVPLPGERHAGIVGRLIVDGDLRGNLVSDAHLAALAIEYGVGICSADSDFARFPEVRWVNPIAG